MKTLIGQKKNNGTYITQNEVITAQVWDNAGATEEEKPKKKITLSKLFELSENPKKKPKKKNK